MPAVTRFWRSTVGKKIVMAVTGLVWVAFVILHMAGNLQAFLGAEKLNAYAAMLHGPLAELVWLQRIALFIALVLHVTAAVQLTRLRQSARPVGYHGQKYQGATWGSRSMRIGGFLLLVFIVLHILHFTTNTFRPADYVPGNLYANVVASFRIWWVVLLYVVAMVALLGHLFHGAWSSFRSLGVAAPSENALERRFPTLLAFVVTLGFIAVPIAIFFGVIR
jgi:succinate dehydrogenase / fumarate reductase, cytochrome b subunit